MSFDQRIIDWIRANNVAICDHARQTIIMDRQPNRTA